MVACFVLFYFFCFWGLRHGAVNTPKVSMTYVFFFILKMSKKLFLSEVFTNRSLAQFKHPRTSIKKCKRPDDLMFRKFILRRSRRIVPSWFAQKTIKMKNRWLYYMFRLEDWALSSEHSNLISHQDFAQTSHFAGSKGKRRVVGLLAAAAREALRN